LNCVRCGPSMLILLLTMKAPSGGKVMTFCKYCCCVSMTCGAHAAEHVSVHLVQQNSCLI
jgi:hypothetical protein